VPDGLLDALYDSQIRYVNCRRERGMILELGPSAAELRALKDAGDGHA